MQNVNFQNNSGDVQQNCAARANPPRNFEVEEFLKNNNLTYENFMPGFVKDKL